MLHPTHNRLNFGEALRPPSGYELDNALGTTYSLDLEAILFLPVALFFGSDWKIEPKCSNELLTALTKVPEKVQIFCQRGKIAPAPFYHNVLEFWGSNIEQIQMDEFDQSFHPKVWLIRYLNTGNRKLAARYRFMCTSRNLTKSTDWDIAIVMDGEVGRSVKPENEPLAAFVKFLDSKANKKINQEILDETMRIQFELKDGQDEYTFFPIGQKWPNPFYTGDYKASELLVISPFLHTESIQALNKKVKKLTILSTKYELDKLPFDVEGDATKYFQFNPLLETEPCSADENGNLQDLSDSNADDDHGYHFSNCLHAKLYVEKMGSAIRWYIGSANCTNPATEARNVEFLVRISGTAKALLSPSDLLIQLTNTEDHQQGIFVPYDKQSQTEKSELEMLELDMRRTIFDIGNLAINASVTINDQGLYDYDVEIPVAAIYRRENWKVYLQPLSGMNGKKEKIEVTNRSQRYIFPGYELHRLTPYFLFTISDENQIIKTLILKLDIKFPEDRMKKIFSSLVGNWERLLKYLSFLLDREYVENMIDLRVEEKGTGNGTTPGAWPPQFPLYEKLLVAASRDLPALQQAIKLVELLSDEKDESGQLIIQEDFNKLIQTFKTIVDDER